MELKPEHVAAFKLYTPAHVAAMKQLIKVHINFTRKTNPEDVLQELALGFLRLVPKPSREPDASQQTEDEAKRRAALR